MSAGTVERYETSLKYTTAFIEYIYGKKDFPVTAVEHKFITDYEFWLKTERKRCHNSIVKYLKNFKKIIRLALAEGHITKDPFAGISFKLENVNLGFLEDHEIQAIISKNIDIEQLAQLKDTFAFCRFTGLAFSDMKGLREEHLVSDGNGALWIRKRRRKTKNMCNIHLLDTARPSSTSTATTPAASRVNCFLSSAIRR
jgi:site-specific recombinase XerD